MKKTTAFLLAFCTLLIGLMVGASLAPAKKSNMTIGDNNFFGIRMAFGEGKKRVKKKKLPKCCEAADGVTPAEADETIPTEGE